MTSEEYDKALLKAAESFLEEHGLTSTVEAFLAQEEATRIINIAFSRNPGARIEQRNIYTTVFSKEYEAFCQNVQRSFKLMVRITLPERKNGDQDMKSAFEQLKAQYLEDLQTVCSMLVNRR